MKSSTVTLMLCCVVLLAACGSDSSSAGDESNNVQGTYFYEMRGSGEGMTVELRPNGLAIGTLPGMGAKEGSYFAEGNRVMVRLEGRATDLVYTVQANGDLLTSFSGDHAVFVKQ